MAHNTGQGIVGEQDVRAALLSLNHRMFVYEQFKSGIVANQNINTFTAPVGAAGNVDTLHTDRNSFEYHILGTQTILGPVRTKKGLNIAMDATADDGVELGLGQEWPEGTLISDAQYATRGSFKNGTDKPFYLAVELDISDVSAFSDDFIVGFRIAAAYVGGTQTYTDYSGLGFNGTDAVQDIDIRDRLNSDTATNSDTTNNWTDADVKTIMVLVDSDGSLTGDGTKGKVYHYINGVKPATELATRFQFDNADIITPFILQVRAASPAGTADMSEWDSGFYPLASLVAVP